MNLLPKLQCHSAVQEVVRQDGLDFVSNCSQWVDISLFSVYLERCWYRIIGFSNSISKIEDCFTKLQKM